MNDSALKREGKEVLNFNKNRTKKQRARIFLLRILKSRILSGYTDTTMIYTHVATKDLLEIESQLDKIIKDLKNTTDKNNQKLTLSGEYKL